jgi:HEAT repeat protein
MRSIWVVLAVVVVSMVFLLRPAPGVDIHGQLQQRLLEAELGSSTTFHFANGPRTLVPDNNPAVFLLTRLESSSPETRWQAAEQLAIRRDPRAVDAVIRAMRDPEGTIRVCVMASALGHLKDPRALSALTEAAFSPINRDLRLCAIQSLGMIGDRRAVPALIDALQAGNTPIAAANAIARMGDDRGVEPIIEAAGNPDLRLWMVMALGELGSPAAVPWLSSLVNDSQPAVRRVAKEAQWKIARLTVTDPVLSLAEVLAEETSVERRMWSAFRLGELGRPQAIPALILALADHEPSVQGRAAAALIRIGTSSVLAITQTATGASGQMQYYAAATLGYIGGQEDIAVLQSIAVESNDEIVVAIAKRSIELIESFNQPANDFVELANL